MTLDDSQLSPELGEVALRAWQQITDQATSEEAAALALLIEQHGLQGQLARVLACSPFAAELLRRRPGLLPGLIAGNFLARGLAPGELSTELSAALSEPEAELGVVLRQFRQRHMLRIVWRDFCKLASTLETTAEVSALAECCIRAAQAHCHRALVAKHGEPRGRDSGEAQQLIVLAMGKLGARELNLSSDIDLIFTYPEPGQTDGDSGEAPLLPRMRLARQRGHPRHLHRDLVRALDSNE